MIPGFGKRDEQKKHERSNYEEMQRGGMVFVNWGILAQMDICPIRIDDAHNWPSKGLEYLKRHGYIAITDKWRITDSGRAALTAWRDSLR